MSDGVMDRLARENPVPETMPALPIELLRQRLDQQPSALRSDPLAVETHHARSPRFPSIGAFVPIISAIVAVVIGIEALMLLGGHKRSTQSAATQRAATLPPAERALASILGVLRRPQTAADRAAAPEAAGGSDPALVRLVAVTPWGERVTLAPYPAGAHDDLCIGFVAALATPARGARARAARAGRAHSGGGDCGLTAALIEAGHGWSLEGAGHNFAGGSTAVRLLIVVPDGVAKVAFVLPRQPVPASVPGGPVYRHSLTVAVPVHNNLAFVQINRECCDGNLVTRWFAADGRLIKVTGNPAATNHAIAVPQPAPETALSRAAERNPSTPNPVHALPRFGDPATSFGIQWRLLLTDADYRITAVGPKGSGCSGAGGVDSEIGGGLDDVRGHLFGGILRGGRGTASWCPGTYRVRVAVMDLGSAGNLKHPARPFGTTTFTVRR